MEPQSASDTSILERWPGKSANAAGIEQPALYHMLDVAAVAEQLIAPREFPEALSNALALLVALHDLGKISESFRSMLREGAPQRWKHWELSNIFLCRYDATIAAILGGEEYQRQAFYACVAGHHGRPPSEAIDDPRLDGKIGLQACTDAETAIHLLADLWPGASLSTLDPAQFAALDWWLPGLATVADWIGSNTSWFPATAPGPTLADYLQKTRRRAIHAVTAAGLGNPSPASGPLFDFVPRPMQQAAATVPLAHGPMLAVIEDETGSGKTEAALLLAQRLLLAGKGRGLFFALPTTATADAMFARARASIRNLFSTPPSLTLAHGRAALSADFREVQGTNARYSEAPVCSDWLADNRRKALLATVGIGTIDQALLSVLPTRFATLRHYGLADKILIVDEVHEMGVPYMAAELAQLLRLHRLAGGSAILLTATLPLAQRRQLIAAWGRKDDDNPTYPALTVAGEARGSALPPVATRPRGQTMVTRLSNDEEAIQLLQACAAKGAACVWVRNAVDDAIAAVNALRGAGVAADLLHARFTLADRLRHERRLLERFGKDGEGRAGQVLVATQVVESSLDLDFDVMVSDLAPMAALIQRAGRLWRHMDRRPAAQRPLPEPVLHVVSPDPADVADAHWLHRVLDRGAFVYPVSLQWRTAKVLFEAGRIEAPAGLRSLIEAAHGDDAIPLPAALEGAEQERIGKGYAETNQARRNLVDLAAGYRGSSAAPDTDYPTRLGLPQRALLLARSTNGVLVPFAGNNDAEGWQLSEVQAAEHRLQKLALPEQERADIAALTAHWPEWKKRTATVCPLGEDGRISAGLSYDPERGLLFDG